MIVHMKNNNFLNCIVDDNRRKILQFLGKNEKCVCEIIDALQLEQSLVSHHLHLLKCCGLVTSKKVGKKNYYKLIDEEIYQILEQINILSNRIQIKGECITNE